MSFGAPPPGMDEYQRLMAERAAAENLALPMWGGIGVEQQERVVATVKSAVGVVV